MLRTAVNFCWNTDSSIHALEVSIQMGLGGDFSITLEMRHTTSLKFCPKEKAGMLVEFFFLQWQKNKYITLLCILKHVCLRLNSCRRSFFFVPKYWWLCPLLSGPLHKEINTLSLHNTILSPISPAQSFSLWTTQPILGQILINFPVPVKPQCRYRNKYSLTFSRPPSLPP